MTGGAGAAGAVSGPPRAPKPAAALLHPRGMGVAEALRVSAGGLLANKMRSFLTMLGIIIGVSAVIIMVNLGQGVAAALNDAIGRLGTNVLMVVPESLSTGAVNRGLGTQQSLKLPDADALLACPSVGAVTPEVRGVATVEYGNENTQTTVYGVGPDYFQIRNLPIGEGQGFDESHVRRRSKVVVIGHGINETLFGKRDAVGEYVRIKGQRFEVVGVLVPRSAIGPFNADDQVTVPVTTALRRLYGQDYLTGISVQARSDSLMHRAQAEVEQAMRRAHRLHPSDEPDVRVFNQADIIESANQQAEFMTMLLAGIASVSLIVGGIGIMNIMLVSVTERTREIGIRMAVGARRSAILYQFMIESVFLSLVGGLIGIGFGVGVSMLLLGTLGVPVEVSVPAIIVSFCFAAVVGIFFGIYPAVKASRLDPIEALRYE